MKINLNVLEKKYNKLITEYSKLEEAQLNLFNNLGNIYNFDWKDGNSYNFSIEIDKDRLETDSFAINIKEKIDLLNSIYYKYSMFGKIINCNLQQKNSILTSIDNCINQVSYILQQFNSMNLNYAYPEFNILRAKKVIFESIKSNLNIVKEQYEIIFSKIDSIESEIASAIRELEEFTIKEYSYNFSQSSEYIAGASLVQNTFEIDCGKFDFYKNEEDTYLNNIYKNLNSMGTYYTSSNVNLFQNHLINFKKAITEIDSKRSSYMNTLNQVPGLYGIVVNKVIDDYKVEE